MENDTWMKEKLMVGRGQYLKYGWKGEDITETMLCAALRTGSEQAQDSEYVCECKNWNDDIVW